VEQILSAISLFHIVITGADYRSRDIALGTIDLLVESALYITLVSGIASIASKL
jgi:hypothetical protein